VEEISTEIMEAVEELKLIKLEYLKIKEMEGQKQDDYENI